MQRPRRNSKRNQTGYALIGTLGALTVMLILISGTMSMVAHEIKREREAEMLFRGRQIVEAVARYQTLMQRLVGQRRQGAAAVLGVWPGSLDELAKGIDLGTTRRIRLLRHWALKDPMMPQGGWRAIGYGDPALKEFLETYFDYVGRTIPPQIQLKYLGADIDFGGDDEQQRQNRQRAIGLAFGRSLGASPNEDEQPSFLFGVVSESEEKTVRDYYGLERYNQWVFAYIPELQQVVATGDSQIQMVARELVYPSDPLMWNLNPLARRAAIMASPARRVPTDRGPTRTRVPTPPPDRNRPGQQP